MNNFTFEDILEIQKTNPQAPLMLHWEGSELEASYVTPEGILQDIEEGEYTAEDFDAYAYCCTESDYSYC